MKPGPKPQDPGPASPSRPKRGAEIDLRIDSLVYGGEAVGHASGLEVSVKYAAPGERVRVRLDEVKRGRAEATLLDVLEPSAHRVHPLCPLFTACGGCNWQHVDAAAQHAAKEGLVRAALNTLPGGDAIPMRPIVAAPAQWRYRNKMEFTFGQWGDAPIAAGFHRLGNWREILDVERCWLAPEAVERILRAAVAEGRRQGLSAWDPRRHEGTLRQLIVRHSAEEDKLIAALMTGDRSIDFAAFADALFATEPRLAGIVWALNDVKSDVARTSDVLETRGTASFEERLGRFRFRVSLASFFQTNTRGAELLYQTAREALELTGRELLLDAYCGTGTIGIFCADSARHVYGIELIQEAIWDARENAVRNGLSNTTFMAGDMARTLPTLMGAVPGRFDRLVVDPPRSGMESKALERLVSLRAPLAAYVSCNPTTMARDLKEFLEAGYNVEWVTPVDMFPQTYHVECVAKLRLPAPA